MKVLPNGLKVFNATPHIIRFFDGVNLIEVETDEVINATVSEKIVYVDKLGADEAYDDEVFFVTPHFLDNDEGWETIEKAKNAGADLIIGSIIAAQAYPGSVFGMVPYPGFERVDNDKKRMRIDTFTIFEA